MGRSSKPGSKKLTQDKLKSAILKYFVKNPKKRLNAAQLTKKMSVKNSRDAINHAMMSLMHEDLLRHIKEGKYVLNRKAAKRLKVDKTKSSQSKKLYTGTVEKIKSGAAYILVDSLEKDVYVPEPLLGTAINGDEVEVAVSFIKGRNPEGRVKKILKRNTKQVMGKLKVKKKGSGVVVSSSRKDPLTVAIPKEDFKGAQNGDSVLVDITSWGKKESLSISGKVVKVFDQLDDHNWTMESILVENGFSSNYPDEVMKELDAISGEITAEDIAERRDFREVLTFTIDPDTAQDFDDAISYEELENGDVEIGVHIADVTHYLKPKTALDKEAYNRSTSVYLVDRCIAMLPEKLSNDLCSLKPNVDRLVFSASFVFNKKHKLIKEWFGKAIIHSDKRFTYDEGQESLDNPEGLYHKELTVINQVAHKLRKAKFKDGAIAFESDEVKFKLDENNKPVDVFVKQRKDVHMLIEDFMLLANRRVAHFIATKNEGKEIPFVYRIHDLPDTERLGDLALFMKEFGYKLDLSTPDNIGKSFNKLSEKSKTDSAAKLLMTFAIRTMAKAIYSTDNIGHYGLRFEHYSHFTSPIRRYSDVLAHRILEKNLSGDHYADKNKLEAQCIHISKQERKAMEAERDSVKYKKVEYMSEHIGEEFDGIISGMIDRGVFVELSASKAEGFISFDDFKTGFKMNQGRYKATDKKGKNSLRLGDMIRVKVMEANLEKRQIELEIVN